MNDTPKPIYRRPLYRKQCPVCGKRFKTRLQFQIYDKQPCNMQAYRMRCAELLDKARAAGVI